MAFEARAGRLLFTLRSCCIPHSVLDKESFARRESKLPEFRRNLADHGEESTCFWEAAVFRYSTSRSPFGDSVYICGIVLGMLLLLVIHDAWNIKLSQRPTKASFNHRSCGTTVTFLSLRGTRETYSPTLLVISLFRPLFAALRYFLPTAAHLGGEKCDKTFGVYYSWVMRNIGSLFSIDIFGVQSTTKVLEKCWCFL